jgi:hypothetical protein
MRRRYLAVLGAMPSVLLAQPSRVTLKQPDATLAHEFTRVESVRELKDGRLLVSDPRDRGLVLVDFRSGQVNDVSHKGRGPGEYSSANSLFPLAGDSTLMADNGNRRWLLLDGDRVIGTIPPDNPAVLATQVSVSGSDSLGHVMSQRRNPPRPGASTIDKQDSTTLLLVTRVNGKSDTVTAIRRQPGRMEAQYGADGKLLSTRITLNASVAGEKSLLFRDGWLAVVRMEPYRVDWRSPDGKWTLGSPLPVPSIAFDAREKRAEMERRAKEYGTPVTSPDAVTDWPTTLPPIRPSGVLVESSDGRLLVPRQPSADHPETTYDIVNRRGQLDAELTLPPSERIIGFGRTSVYVVAVDDDGIERLRRHPWTARR